MSFFNKLISTGSSLFTKSTPDYSYGLIVKLDVENMLQTERWNEFERIILSLGSEDLTRLLDGLCLTDKYEVTLRNYFTSVKSEVKELVAGTYHLFLAWDRRGANIGASLTSEQIDAFTYYLGEANRNFSEHFSTPILEAESFARLVRVYMGFSDTEAAHSAFANAVNLVPDHLLANLNYFKVTSPKWLGDLETMHKFVTQIRHTPLKDLLQLMFLVEAYSDVFSNNSAKDKAIFQKQHGEFIANILATVVAPTDDSLLAIYTRNYLVCIYRILGHGKEGSGLKKQLEGRRTNYPWAYFGWN